MIRFVPKWSIIPWDGGYLVCLKPGGLMIYGKTIEDAKKAFKEMKRQEDLDDQEV